MIWAKVYWYVRLHLTSVDDLPVIRESIRKGFLETQTKVNSWVNILKKKIDGEDDEEAPEQPPRPGQGFHAGPSPQPYGIRRSGELGRRSGDRERYDADPQLIGDDFATLQLRDEEGTVSLSRMSLALSVDHHTRESTPLKSTSGKS